MSMDAFLYLLALHWDIQTWKNMVLILWYNNNVKSSLHDFGSIYGNASHSYVVLCYEPITSQGIKV